MDDLFRLFFLNEGEQLEMHILNQDEHTIQYKCQNQAHTFCISSDY